MEQVYREERQTLLRVAYLLTGNRDLAEEAVQDAFTTLQARWDRLQEPGKARGYVRVCLVNRARSQNRRRLLALRHPILPDVPTSGVEERVVLSEEHRRVAAAVARLPRRQQQVVVLRYWGDMGEAEIAEHLRITPGTVKSTASRALAAISEHLEAQERP